MASFRGRPPKRKVTNRGGKVDPKKFFGAENFEKLRQEIATEGTIDGKQLTPEERKKAFKASRNKVAFKKFVEDFIGVKSEPKTQVGRGSGTGGTGAPPPGGSKPKMLPGTAVAPLARRTAVAPLALRTPPQGQQYEPEVSKVNVKDVTPQKPTGLLGLDSLEKNVAIIRKTVDSIFNTLSDQNKFLNKQSDLARKKGENQKRAGKEDEIEKGKDNKIKKSLDKVVKPFSNILEGILNYLTAIFLGRAFVKLMDWFGDEKNQGKLESIGRFLKDWWPALLGAYLIFGNSFTRFVIGFVAKLGFFTAKLALKIVPKLLAAAAKNPLAAAAVGVAAVGGAALLANKITGQDKAAPVQADQQAKVDRGKALPVQGTDTMADKMPSTGNLKPPSPTGSLQGASGGGFVKALRGGGDVTTESGTDIKGAGVDTQLIAAQPGEVVINKPTVDALGSDFFLSLNKKYGGSNANKPKLAKNVQTAAGGGLVLPAFAGGGMVGGQDAKNFKNTPAGIFNNMFTNAAPGGESNSLQNTQEEIKTKKPDSKFQSREKSHVVEPQLSKAKTPTEPKNPSAGSHRVVPNTPESSWAAGIPLTYVRSGGQSAEVAVPLAKRFQGFLNDLKGTGYKIDQLGGFRKDGPPAGNKDGKGPLYSHPYGAAIDINWNRNPAFEKKGNDFPSNTKQIASKHGLGWGRAFDDAMHFSAMKREYGAGIGGQEISRKSLMGSKGDEFSGSAMSPPPVSSTPQSSTPSSSDGSSGKREMDLLTPMQEWAKNFPEMAERVEPGQTGYEEIQTYLNSVGRTRSPVQPTNTNYEQMSIAELSKMLRTDLTPTSAEFQAAKNAREEGKAAGLSGEKLEQKVLAATVRAKYGKSSLLPPPAASTSPPPAASSTPLSSGTSGMRMPDPEGGGTAGTNIQQTSHPDTGSGYTIPGTKDASGRPPVFSKGGAIAFARMMKDSKGQVKTSDITSSRRSPAKNRAVGGVPRSNHLGGNALDIHGSSQSWMRRLGKKYGWIINDYPGSHGGHFDFKGGGSSDSAMSPPPASSTPPSSTSPPSASASAPTGGEGGGRLGNYVQESTGISAPGATAADRRFLPLAPGVNSPGALVPGGSPGGMYLQPGRFLKPGEYILTPPAVEAFGGVNAVDRFVAAVDRNSTAAKLGTLSKPSMAVEPRPMSANSMVSTLPPITQSMGAGGGSGGGGGVASKVPSVSISSNSFREAARKMYGLA